MVIGSRVLERAISHNLDARRIEVERVRAAIARMPRRPKSEPAPPPAKRSSSHVVSVKRFFFLSDEPRSEQTQPSGVAKEKFTQINSEEIEAFVRDFAREGLSSESVQDLIARYPGCIVIDPPSKEALNSITLRDFSTNKIDISGVSADVQLTLQRCRVGIFDASNAKLSSLTFANYEGLDGTSGTVFLYNLALAGDLDFVGESHFELVMAEGVTARRVFASPYCRFSTAERLDQFFVFLTDELNKRIQRRSLGNTGADQDVISEGEFSDAALIKAVARAALWSDVLDLSMVNVKTVSLGARFEGRVSLEDAKIELRLQLSGGTYVSGRELVLNRLSEGRETFRQWRDISRAFGVVADELEKEVWECLTLKAVDCAGTIEFQNVGAGNTLLGERSAHDGVRPHVSGHISLQGARCRLLADDHSLWRLGNRWGHDEITYDLRNFCYDYFDMQTITAHARTKSVSEEVVAWLRSRQTDGGESETREVARSKIDWLKNSVNTARRGKFDGNRFDAQPWSQCAATLRRGGWRAAADAVLHEREKQIYRSNLLAPYLRVLLYFLGAVGGLVIFPSLYTASQSPGMGDTYALLCASALTYIYVGWRTGWFSDLGRLLLKWTVGFGYQPLRAVLWSTAIVLTGALLFSTAHSESAAASYMIRNPGSWKPDGGMPRDGRRMHDSPQSAAPVELTSSSYFMNSPLTTASADDYRDCGGYDKAACDRDLKRQPLPDAGPTAPSLPQPESVPKVETVSSVDAYPRFNPLMYSVDVFIPVIDFSQGAYWIPGRECAMAASGAAENKHMPLCKEGAKRSHISFASLLIDLGLPQSRANGWAAFRVWWKDVFIDVLWLWYWFTIAAGWWLTIALAASLTGLLERKAE